MNAVEIEEELLKLTGEPFDAAQFPFQFLLAFGHKDTTIRKLRSGTSNASDVPGGVLLRNYIHLAIANPGEVSAKLQELKASPKTVSAKAKFVLATDGEMVELEDISSGDTKACPFSEMAAQCFGMLLPLAGITTVREIQNNPIDIRATGRLNRLYLELLKENPEWEKAERRHDLNQFMSRLIFCLFAEDTGIFYGEQTFTATLTQMSTAENTHEVIGELFRAMDTKPEERLAKKIKSWADVFPYVNGGLFDGNKEVPRFSKIARAYLLQAGSLDWKLINPDIFGSMIQAVADDDERGELGMHYTSVPNILKVLNPLFLDDLREQLAQAGDNGRKLLNLRRRMANIRVFDPACGSGNFLVIAYIQMREIEAEIIRRRRDDDKKSWIKLANFYGIEIKDFAVEIARLALLIAEFQCDVRMIGQQEARSLVLPLKKTGQITCGNALRLDWLQVCPPAKPLEHPRKDLFDDVPEPLEVDLDAAEPETYVCGNPPYYGSKWQTEEQKADLEIAFKGVTSDWKSLDYVAGWFIKSAQYGIVSKTKFAFVSTNSICQGQQVAFLWPHIFETGSEIVFAHTSFKWANLASHNAGVIVVIIGLSRDVPNRRQLFQIEQTGLSTVREVDFLNAYLIPAADVIVQASSKPANSLPEMLFGNMPRDGGHLLLSSSERRALIEQFPGSERYLKLFQGSEDFLSSRYRGCIWIDDSEVEDAETIPPIQERIASVEVERRKSNAASTRQFAMKSHRFVQIQGVAKNHSIIVPRHTSESRDYLPVGINSSDVIIADSALAIYDAPLWTLSIIASRIHLVWIAAVCGKIKTDYRYSNTLGWNTFPAPKLSEKNKTDMSMSAAQILLAREECFPATVAELYVPENMPEPLRQAHQLNDEIVERMFIGRKFKNDTERLEKLFDLFSNKTQSNARPIPKGK